MRYIEREELFVQDRNRLQQIPNNKELVVVGVVSIVDERGGGESWSRILMFRVRDSRFNLQSCSYTCVPSTGGQACHQIVAATPVSSIRNDLSPHLTASLDLIPINRGFLPSLYVGSIHVPSRRPFPHRVLGSFCPLGLPLPNSLLPVWARVHVDSPAFLQG